MTDFSTSFTNMLNDRPATTPGAALLCTCPSTADILNAGFAGEPRPRCEKHDVTEIAARKTEQERAEAEARAKRLGDIQAELTLEHEARAIADADRIRQRAVDARRAEVDPLALFLADKAGANPDPARWGTADLAIGDDAGFANVLTGIFGPGTVNNNTGFNDAA